MDEREMLDAAASLRDANKESADLSLRLDKAARLLEQAARRTTPDREAIIAAAWKVVREALDDVVVHPCYQHDDDVKARSLPLHMHALYLALKADSDKECAYAIDVIIRNV